MWANDSVLSIFSGDTEAYFFDSSGRFFAAWDHGWFISQGLSGRSVARRWKGTCREVRPLKPEEIRRLVEKSKTVLQTAGPGPSPDANRWLGRALNYDPTRDAAAYRAVYRPVGILPPDQYNAVVVQITEGCGWNRCHFCAFYRGQTYRVKTREQIAEHIDRVAAFFGDGLSLRRSIFLGEASALGAPSELVAYAMEAAAEKLIPRMPHFRGFYAFNEAMDSACRTTADFRALARRGLKRVYYGLETGHPELRARLGKPGTLRRIEDSIEQAKAAGVKVAVILLAGAGGRGWAQRHLEESIRFARRLPLDGGDIVFISPLHGADGTSESPLAEAGLAEQIARLRRGIGPPARTAPYDIREFVY